VRETVTTAPAAPPTTAPTTTAPTATTAATTTAAALPSSSSGASLNNAGYAKMQAGDYAGAQPLLEQAVGKLDGTGVLDEAYAKYNLAYTRFALGDCTDVDKLLEDAQTIEGHRQAIDDLRKQEKQRCKK
jgi:TolA-binding protein